MNMQFLVLAICAAVTFFGGVLQAIVAGIELKKHTAQSKQKQRWLTFILTCMLLTIFFGYTSYESYAKKDDPISIILSNTPTSVSNTSTSVSNTPTSVLNTPTSVPNTPTSVSNTPIPFYSSPTPLSSNPTPLPPTPTPTDQILKTYEAYINDLVLNHGLSVSKQGNNVNNLAHAETLSTIPQLDNSGKRSLLQFLRNAQLIGYDHYIIFLNNVDLSHADLNHVDLSGVNLNRANLSYANLSYADLSGSNIGNVNFTNANLDGALFLGNDLANSNANLSGATMPDGKKHP